MSWTRLRGSELVLGMTLAEIFLLGLFVVLLSMTVVGKDLSLLEGINRDLNIEIQDLKIQIKEQEAELNRLKVLETKYQVLLKIVGYSPGVEREGGGPTPEEIVTALKRGQPVCDFGRNRLVVVTARNGMTEVTLRADFPPVAAKYTNGQVLSGSTIDTFLSEVNTYYKQRSEGDCRYDYHLQWVTDTDHRASIEKFEDGGYFHPDGRRQIPYRPR